MKIVVLDKSSMGCDTPFDSLMKIGEVVFYDSSTPEEALLRVKDAEVVITNKCKITAELMDNAKELKIVCVFATGYDNIDISAAKERAIAVCNVPGYSTDSVALYTVTTVLTLCSKIIEYNEYVKNGSYTASGVPNCLVPVYHELRGKTWGIIGCGNIGKAVAKVAEAFGARVIVNKKTPTPEFNCVDIDTLCKESDIITVHCPLNDQTRGIINEERLSMMKPEVILVNEARGAVLCEKAVADAIKKGIIGGFGCDVYSVEPFPKEHPYNEIMHLKNVLLTPHSAWGAYEARARCASIIAENVAAFYDGKSKNRVDN